MNCPSCKAKIPDIAETCKCGWQRVKGTTQEYIHCAVETCPTSAITRVKTTTGMANLCAEHYDAYWLKQAKHYCAERGLDTREKRYKWARAKMMEMGV